MSVRHCDLQHVQLSIVQDLSVAFLEHSLERCLGCAKTERSRLGSAGAVGPEMNIYLHHPVVVHKSICKIDNFARIKHVKPSRMRYVDMLGETQRIALSPVHRHQLLGLNRRGRFGIGLALAYHAVVLHGLDRPVAQTRLAILVVAPRQGAR